MPPRSTAPAPVARFRYVTWPALLPVTFYLAIVNAIAASQVFTPTYVLTRGGPDDATLTTALYTYQTAFASGRLGYASAMAMVVVRRRSWSSTALLFRFVGRRVPVPRGRRREPRAPARGRALLRRRRWSSPSRVPFVWLVASAFKPVDQFYAVAADAPARTRRAWPTWPASSACSTCPGSFANTTFIALLSASSRRSLSSAVVGLRLRHAAGARRAARCSRS